MNPSRSRNKAAEKGRAEESVFVPYPLLPPLYDDGELMENAKMLF